MQKQKVYRGISRYFLHFSLHTISQHSRETLKDFIVYSFCGINGVFKGVFNRRCAACEDAGQAAYSQLRLLITGKYNRQQAVNSCQNHRNVARHPVYTQQVNSYSHTRSQKLEISSVWRIKCSVHTRQRLAVYTRALIVKILACGE